MFQSWRDCQLYKGPIKLWDLGFPRRGGAGVAGGGGEGCLNPRDTSKNLFGYHRGNLCLHRQKFFFPKMFSLRRQSNLFSILNRVVPAAEFSPIFSKTFLWIGTFFSFRKRSICPQFRISPHRRNVILGIENHVKKGLFP